MCTKNEPHPQKRPQIFRVPSERVGKILTSSPHNTRVIFSQGRGLQEDGGSCMTTSREDTTLNQAAISLDCGARLRRYRTLHDLDISCSKLTPHAVIRLCHRKGHLLGSKSRWTICTFCNLRVIHKPTGIFSVTVFVSDVKLHISVRRTKPCAALFSGQKDALPW